MIQVELATESGDVVRFRLARQMLGRPSFYQTAACWVDGLLIDTGCAHSADQLCCALGNLGVDQIANTHSYQDHIGANVTVQGMSLCPVLAHPGALPVLENPGLQPLQPYRRLLWGWPKTSHGGSAGHRVETARLRFP